MHPEYVRHGEPWLDPRISAHVAALATDDGLARPGVRPVGLPWQEPDGGFASVGRTDLFEAVDTEGRTEDRRSDFCDVYGDWDVRAVGRRRGSRVTFGCDPVDNRHSIVTDYPPCGPPRRTRATCPTSTR